MKKRVNPCFQPRILKLFHPNGMTQRSALWIIWKLTEIYFGHHDAKLVGSFLEQKIDRQERDEPAVTVFVTSDMAGIAKRTEELLGTPEGMAKALEPEPWEKCFI